MRRGLAEGQFVAYFQPIIDAASREPVALEALARWHRPDGRFLGPDVFIPIAEESSLIGLLGASMLRQSCEQLQAWRGTPLSHLTMAFNVSTVQLADPGFVDTVAAILQSTGVAGSQLAMEITESTLMRDPDATLQVAAADQGARHPHRGRRLRHRLLESQPPEALPGGQREDRPLVRARPRDRSGRTAN